MSPILTAATAEFVAKGYRDASLDRIVTAARISKTTFYKHFNSKRDVLQAALDQVESGLNTHFPPPDETADIEATLVHYSKWIRRIACSAEYIALYKVSVELARMEPEFAMSIHERIRDRKTAFWEYLEKLTRSGMRMSAENAVLQAQFGFLSIGGLTTIISDPELTLTDENRWMRSVATLFMKGYRRDQTDDASTSSTLIPTLRPGHSLESSDALYTRLRNSGMRLSRDQFDALLDISAERFLENGYRDTALPDISARSGVSRMTLRRQFNGKAELFIAAISHYAHKLYSRSAPLPGGDTIDATLQRVAIHLHAHFHRPDNIRLLRLIATQAAAFPAFATAVYWLCRKDNLENLQLQFAEWRIRGALGSAYADLAAHHFHTLAVNGNAALFRSDGSQTDASPDNISSLFLDGCFAAR